MGTCVLQKSQGGQISKPRSARFVAHYRSITTSKVRQFRLPLSTSGYRRESVERPNAQHKQVRKPANAANLYVPQIPWRLHVKSAGRRYWRRGSRSPGLDRRWRRGRATGRGCFRRSRAVGSRVKHEGPQETRLQQVFIRIVDAKISRLSGVPAADHHARQRLVNALIIR